MSPLIRFPRHYVRIVAAWIPLAVFVAATAFWGFQGLELVWNITVLLLCVGLGCVYPAYLAILWKITRGRPVTVEGGHLVQRTSTGRVVGSVDLSESFDARRVYNDIDWVYYRVSQRRQVIRLILPIDGDGSLVRDVLHLPWPPPTPSPFRYL